MNIIPAAYTEYALLPYYDMPHVLLHVHASFLNLGQRGDRDKEGSFY